MYAWQLSIQHCWWLCCYIWKTSIYSEGSPHSSVSKESTCNAGDPGSIPGSGRSHGEGISYPLQYSWTSLVAQTVKNLPCNEEDHARPNEGGHGNPLQWILAWEIPWIEEPGGLQSMGLQRVGIPERVAISFSLGSSQLRKWIWVFCIDGWMLYHWSTREAHFYIVFTSKNNQQMNSRAFGRHFL